MGILDTFIGTENSGPLADPEKAFRPTGLMGAFGGGEGLLNFGLALMANSGNVGRRRGLGEIVGNSFLQSQMMAQEQAARKIREQYMQAQMEQMRKPRPVETDVIVDPVTGRPKIVRKEDSVGQSPYLENKQDGPRMGVVNPDSYTPESVAAYEATINPTTGYGDFRVLKPRGTTPPAPSYSQVQLEDGSIGAFDVRTGEIVPTGQKGKRQKPPGMDLRREFEGLDAVKNYMTVLPLYERASSAPNTRAGDISVIYALGKMFDPTSVVREGELILSQNAAPWLAKVVNEAKSQVTGQGSLSPATRTQIMQALKGQVDALRSGYERERQRYSGYAPQYGANPEDIVGGDPAAAFSSPASSQDAASSNAPLTAAEKAELDALRARFKGRK